MGQIKLCDGTLSWGGSVINWDFGAVRIPLMKHLVESGVDVVELGVLSDREYEKNHVDYYATSIIKDIPNRGNTQFSLLVDTSRSCSLEYVEPMADSCIDLFRVMIWKDSFDEGLQYCRKLKEKGYPVCAILVCCGEYQQTEFCNALKKICSVDPRTIYIDDYFGMLSPEETMQFFEWADEILPQKIALGYRGADSLRQVSMTAHNICTANFARDCFLDGGIHGFAPQAGTLDIESIARYLSEKKKNYYNEAALRNAYEVCVKKIEPAVNYGYQIIYERAALAHCDPHYAFYFKYVLGATEEEILAALPYIKKEWKLHFSEEHAKDSLRAYRKQFWRNKFCVIVPTANRAKDIRFYLDTISKCHGDLGIDLIIYDSSSDSKTQEAVERHQRFGETHVRYCKYTGKFDGISLDDKVIAAYEEFSKQYKYVWITRDGLIAHIGAIYNKLYQKIAKGLDMFVVYTTFQDWENIGERNYNQDSLAEFFRDNCRHMTILGSTIVSAPFIRNVLSSTPLDKKTNYGMWQPIAFFEYIAEASFRAETIVGDVFIPNKYATPTSFWNKSGRALWQWGERWYTMISSLPAEYDLEKPTVLHIEMMDFHPFYPQQLITMRANGSLTFKKWKENKHFLNHVTEVEDWKFITACCVPRWICRVVRSRGDSVFAKAIKKLKKLLVGAYHIFHPPVTPAPIPLIAQQRDTETCPVRFQPGQLCIVIPTADRASILEDVLTRSAADYQRHGIDVAIWDSSSDSTTEDMVRRLSAQEGLKNISYYRYDGPVDTLSLDTKVLHAYQKFGAHYEYVWMLRDRLMVCPHSCAYGIWQSMRRKCDVISIHNKSDDSCCVGSKNYSNPGEFFREQFVSMTVLGNTIIRGDTVCDIIKKVPLNKETNYGLWQPVAFFQYFATEKMNAASLSGDFFLYHISALQSSFWMKQLLWQWGERWYKILHALPSNVYGAEKYTVISMWNVKYPLLGVPYLLTARTKNALSVSEIKKNAPYLPYVSTVPIETFYRIARYPRLIAVLACKTYTSKMWRKIRESYDDTLFGQIE